MRSENRSRRGCYSSGTVLTSAPEVTSGEVADEHLLDRLLKEHAGTTGRTVAEAVADTKYGTHANYAALEAQGNRARIPSVSAVRVRGTYGADRFVYEAAADRYRCPAGQYLTRYGASCTAASRRRWSCCSPTASTR